MSFGSVQVFLSRGRPSPQGCAIFFVVSDADSLFAVHRANGVVVVDPLDDRPWGLRDYTVEDLHGYKLTFGHPIFHVGPPVEIERVDVPVRLEKRLAAVLEDLAAFKRMTVSRCLEETLLHTFEPVGDGVASPHTTADLRRIQELALL